MILVTGSAGFVGFHVCRRLISEGHSVAGIDNLNAYYDVGLKRARNAVLRESNAYAFHEADISDAAAMGTIFSKAEPSLVIHLAAQAGVRHSLTHPRDYAESNLMGFFNVLEACRASRAGHFIYASSSSVYGLNSVLPFTVHQTTEHPVSLYAASKKANELMAHSYSHLYGMPTTGLRLFTVYGPWGRPDMALFTFTRAILAGEPIRIFGDGHMRRDYTYVDDVVEGIIRLGKKPAAPNRSWNPKVPDPAASSAPYRIYNIGGAKTIEVLRLVEILEACLGKKAVKVYEPAQACEVAAAEADSSDIARDTGYAPDTPLETGVARFVEWYRQYYKK
jgi:UDP-glucuronate 4-epimerase